MTGVQTCALPIYLVTSSTMNTYNIGMMKGFEFAIPERKQKMVTTIDNIMGARRPTIQAARSRDTTLKESSNAP